jgi:hypothetical protein
VGQKLNFFLVVGDLCKLPRPHDKAQLPKENMIHTIILWPHDHEHPFFFLSLKEKGNHGKQLNGIYG